MFGRSSKLGGSSRATRLHSPFPQPPPPPSVHRASAPSRLLASRPSRAATAAAAAAAEETFSLVSGAEPRASGMVIKLTRDFVDEIKRVDAEGGAMRIKFDGDGKNMNGNVIDLGGKEFKFQWFPDNCDIYEERQSGDDGNGLLVETGYSWRKLTVRPILDESTKQQVKMRSEEFERKNKSRKAILMNHESPSMKSQVKQMQSAEGNKWSKHRNPLKKPRCEPEAFKPAKTRHSTPQKSSPKQSGAVASPSVNVNIKKSHAYNKDFLSNHMMNKGEVTTSEKENSKRVTGTVQETAAHREAVESKTMDLQSMLMSLLVENPKGMSLKALEKAVGDKIPNSAKKIEPIIKKIATFQAPGRYILKQGVDLESVKNSLPESESSPEDHHQQRTAHEDIRDQPVLELNSGNKGPTDEVETRTEVNSKHEEEPLDIIDIEQHSPDPSGRKKDSDISEVQGGSSSDSGSDSDSDSDSSDSASDSGSKSPAESGSGSGSSSDSDSDVSSNSKGGSDVDMDAYVDVDGDVDVDIMTNDDDKGPKHNLEVSERGFSSSPIPWRTGEHPMENGPAYKQDGHESDALEVEKDVPDNEQATELPVSDRLVPDPEGAQHVEETQGISPDHDTLRERREYIGRLFDEGDNAGEDGLKNEHSDSYGRTSRGKSKRGSDKHFDGESRRVKRLKEESLAQPSISGGRDVQFSGSPHSSAPDRRSNNSYRGPNVVHRPSMGVNADEAPTKPSSDFQQSDRKSFGQSSRPKAPEVSDRPDGLTVSNGRSRKFSGKGVHVHDSFTTQKNKMHADIQDERGYVNEKKLARQTKGGDIGGRNPTPFDSHYQKHGELAGNFKEAAQVCNSNIRSSPKENYGNGTNRPPLVNGGGSVLQREVSALELGELREPFPDEALGKKQFERKSSFKQSENKQTASSNRNSYSNTGKSVGKGDVNLGTHSSPNKNAVVPSYHESSRKWSTTDCNTENKLRSNHKSVQSQLTHPPRIDHENGSLLNKLEDAGTKSRQSETGVSKRIGLDGYEDKRGREPTSTLQQRDYTRGLVSHSAKENRRQLATIVSEFTDNGKDTISADVNNSTQKRRESSSDENSSYSKYEKDGPELKGPIRDYSQYEEYVREYRDKYDTYCSLNKVLESYRNEFKQWGKDLESAKGRDMEKYYHIQEQMNESYRQCGMRHKRLKKTFIILHEELKNLKQRIKDFAITYGRD